MIVDVTRKVLRHWKIPTPKRVEEDCRQLSGSDTEGFREWILKQSFLPLDKTGEGSWQYCLHETVACETLVCFTWIGEKYSICLVTR